MVYKKRVLETDSSDEEIIVKKKKKEKSKKSKGEIMNNENEVEDYNNDNNNNVISISGHINISDDNDNGISSNIMNYNTFMENINNYKLNELKNLSKELGLPLRGKKEELVERIKEFLFVQKSLLKEVNEKESINSFNKNQELSIKDITSTERYFWKVFRNKILFKQIFSNFIFKLSHNYDMLFVVPKIFQYYTNAAEIIKDKVKTNSYLSFNKEYGNQYNGFQLIFSNIKQDTESNRNFYLQLFNNYTSNFETRGLLKTIIGSLNIMAFDLFINIHSEEDFRYVILLPEVNNLESFEMIDHLSLSGWPISSVSFKNFDIFHQSVKLKNLVYIVEVLNEIKELEFEKDEKNSKLDQEAKENKKKEKEDLIALYDSISKSKIEFTEEQLNSTIHELLDSTSALINNDNGNSNSNGGGGVECINSYEQFLDKLLLNDHQKNSIIQLLKEKDQVIKSLESKLKINSNYSNNIVNNDDCNNLINNNNNNDIDSDNIQENNSSIKEIKSKILNYLNYYYSVKKISKPIDYYLIFEEKDRMIEILKEYSLLKEKRTLYTNERFFSFGINKNVGHLSVFSDHFKLISQKSSKYDEISLGNILKSIIQTNNTQFIDFIIKDNPIYFFQNISQALSSITSNQVLDYFFKMHQNVFFSSLNSHWLYIKDISILEHYETLMFSLNRKFLLDSGSKYETLKINKEIGVELLLRAINKPELYLIKEEIKLFKFAELIKFYLIHDRQEEIIELFKMNRFGTIDFHEIIPKNHKSFRLNKIAEWIFSNLKQINSEKKYFDGYRLEIYSNSGDGNTIMFSVRSNLLITFYIISGRYDEVFKLKNVKVNDIIKNLKSYRVQLAFLDKVFQFYKDSSIREKWEVESDEISSDYGYNIISKLIFRWSNVPLLKHLTLKHSNILIKKPSAKGIFTPKNIKKLLERALKLESLELSELLINFNTLMSKSEFKTIVPEDSIIYKSLITKFK